MARTHCAVQRHRHQAMQKAPGHGNVFMNHSWQRPLCFESEPDNNPQLAECIARMIGTVSIAVVRVP
jgi:hypothetical protein